MRPTTWRGSSTPRRSRGRTSRVTVCRDDVCPATPGVRQIHWGFDDPYGRPIEEVRVIRDGILERRRSGLSAELRSVSAPRGV